MIGSPGKVLLNLFEIKGLESVIEKAALYRAVIIPENISRDEFYALINGLPWKDDSKRLLAAYPKSYESREVVAVFDGDPLGEFRISVMRDNRKYEVVLERINSEVSLHYLDLSQIFRQVLERKYSIRNILREALMDSVSSRIESVSLDFANISVEPRYQVEIISNGSDGFRVFLLVDFRWVLASKYDIYTLVKSIFDSDPEDIIEDLAKIVGKRGEIYIYSPRNPRSKSRFDFSESRVIRPDSESYEKDLERILSYYREKYKDVVVEDDMEFFRRLYIRFFGRDPTKDLLENFKSVPIMVTSRNALYYHPMLSKISLSIDVLREEERKSVMSVFRMCPRERLRVIKTMVRALSNELSKHGIALEKEPLECDEHRVDHGKIKFLVRSSRGDPVKISYAEVSPVDLIRGSDDGIRAFVRHHGSRKLSKVIIKPIIDKRLFSRESDKRDVMEFYYNLTKRLKVILKNEGIECYPEFSMITLDMSSESEIRNTIKDMINSFSLDKGVALLVISFGSERRSLGKGVDYYITLKWLGLVNNFVVQNIVWEKEAYKDKKTRRYIINNIIIQVLAKLGIYYYGLSVDSLKEYDYIVGLDAGRVFVDFYGGYTYKSAAMILMGNSGVPERIEYALSDQPGETIDLNKFLGRFSEDLNGKRVLMFRDGGLKRGELEALKEFSSNNETTFVVYEIIKSRLYRMFSERGVGSVGNPAAGTYVLLNKGIREAVLVAADLKTSNATIRPIYMRKRVIENGVDKYVDISEKDVLNVYALTTLMYSMVYKGGAHSKMPVPIYLVQKFLEVTLKILKYYDVNLGEKLKDYGMLFFL